MQKDLHVTLVFCEVCSRDLLIKHIYIYIYKEVYILENSRKNHLDFGSYLVVVCTFSPRFFWCRWHETSSCPLFLPILAAKNSQSGDWNWKRSRKKSLAPSGWANRILKGAWWVIPLSFPNVS